MIPEPDNCEVRKVSSLFDLLPFNNNRPLQRSKAGAGGLILLPLEEEVIGAEVDGGNEAKTSFLKPTVGRAKIRCKGRPVPHLPGGL